MDVFERVLAAHDWPDRLGGLTWLTLLGRSCTEALARLSRQVQFSALAFKPSLWLPFGKTMRRNGSHLGFGQTAKAVTTTFAVMLVLVLGVFAVSPSMHQRLHSDSAHPDHFCIISAFATGQLSWTEINFDVAIACVLLVCGVSLCETPLASYLDLYFSPNRAPPRI